MKFRYLVEIENRLITSVSQVGYASNDSLNKNQRLIFSEKSPSELFNCIIEDDGSLTYLGERGPNDIIDVENRRFVVSLELVYGGIRSKRDLLLKESDWTQLPDVPLATKEAWATYRQALRDITEQPDPFNITWPAVPG